MNHVKSEVENFQLAPLFDPEKGKSIIRPTNNEEGYWAGAPTILYDEKDSTFYLYYRLRNPRGHGEDERGYEVRIASSKDGEDFTDIWSIHKKELNSSSIERSALIKAADSHYRLYISYVDPADNRWRIDVIEAASPSEFKAGDRQKVLQASDYPGIEGIKDPYVVKVDNGYHMYFVYAKGNEGAEVKDMHGTGDVHNTGLAVAPTGLAVSSDGLHFEWTDNVLPVGHSGWDQYQSRLTTIIPYGAGYTVLWDGSIGVEQNYEEKSALAVTFDLKTFAKVTYEGPHLETSLQKAVRYVDGLVHDNHIWYYYEYTREDGAHELRLAKVEL
ncbi:hypothetical protein MUN89_19970 [Halobacillus salinarum]|uniref:Uncharacterized protein n=1 Tax=Halobacillus salinarum TaxID=2932257 RepID=A0ABY4EI40_9BACI|nr:hypothetical protein [Halobacillus salinarum]UOQ44107.1 hypothetical protein MUN89_19970 [Halobacillus salinarum]